MTFIVNTTTTVSCYMMLYTYFFIISMAVYMDKDVTIIILSMGSVDEDIAKKIHTK